MSSIPAPKRASASGSRVMSRNAIAPERAACTRRRFCHAMPRPQTGHLVFYQTVSWGRVIALSLQGAGG